MFASRLTRRNLLRVVAVSALILLMALPALAQAQETPAMPEPFVAEIAAGETVEIPIFGLCLNYTYPFPGQALLAGVTEPDTVRKAIAYSVANDYITTDPWQVQLAVWYFTEGNTRVDEEYGAVADEIIAYAESDAPAPETGATAVPLDKAIADGTVTATLDDFTDVSPPGFSFIGEGTLVITNTTDQPVSVLIPFGTRFSDGAVKGNQDMAIFAQPTAEQPRIPDTGGFLAPEMLAALGMLGLSGGALTVRRLRRPR